MIHYSIKTFSAHRHYLIISIRVDTFGKAITHLQLPAWRPGRYELANFAKNIQQWQVFNEKGESLPFKKITKDCWQINTYNTSSIEVKYNYYACQLDAGGSFLDESQVYINPVNCLFYLADRITEPCSIQLAIPLDYKIASALPFDRHGTAIATNYHELADSPIIASSTLQQKQYTVEQTIFRISFLGNCHPDWERILKDFTKFSLAHIRLFGSMPVKEYHFLFLIVPTNAYHGVEHSKSCVIHFGPGDQLMDEEIYKNFLGICSHELFHCWNIKAIRPIELMNYDYSKEVYSYLGYMAEGVTSYYGDLQLLRCGIYDWNEYSTRLSNIITNYFHTEGRNYQSLSASSFDTWLHGYNDEGGDRRISMYIKGVLFTFLKDIAMRKSNRTGRNFDWFMQILYREYGLEKKGYSIDTIEHLFNNNTSETYKKYFQDFFWGTTAIDDALEDSFRWIGCLLLKIPSQKVYERDFGIKLSLQNNKCLIIQIAPRSPGDMALAIGDEIIAVNRQRINETIDLVLNNDNNHLFNFTILRKTQLLEKSIRKDGKEYFATYKVERISQPTNYQKNQFRLWTGQ